MTEGMSDKNAEELCDWQAGIGNRLGQHTKRLDALEGAMERREAYADYLWAKLAPLLSGSRVATLEVNKRLDKLEGDKKVAVPLHEIRADALNVRGALDGLDAETPQKTLWFWIGVAWAQADALYRRLDELCQPVVRVELNPEAGSDAAIAKEIHRTHAQSLYEYEPDYGSQS